MFKKIFFIANNTIHHEGLSGGDRIYIELARRWSRQTPLVLVGPEETFLLARREGLKCIEFHQTCPRIPHGDDHTLGTLFRNFFKKLFHGIRFVIGHRKLFLGEIAVYSVSDFYPDVIPAYIIKCLNPRVFWIAGFYLFAPIPWRKNSPYRGWRCFRGFLYWFSQRLVYGIVNRKADMVFVTSEPDIKFFTGPHRGRSRVIAIRGGVDTSPSEKAREHGLKPVADRVFDVVFIGRFHPQKGVLELMDIWARVVRRLPRARLAMIGIGPLEAEIDKRTKGLRLEENIRRFGFLDGEAKYRIIEDSRVVVHPAIFDSGGMAAAEAMAWGLPGVSFDLEALRSYYPKGMLKTPCFDLDGFADNICDLLRDNNLYGKLSSEAWALIREEWDWDRRAAAIYGQMNAVIAHEV